MRGSAIARVLGSISVLAVTGSIDIQRLFCAWALYHSQRMLADVEWVFEEV